MPATVLGRELTAKVDTVPHLLLLMVSWDQQKGIQASHPQTPSHIQTHGPEARNLVLGVWTVQA